MLGGCPASSAEPPLAGLSSGSSASSTSGSVWLISRPRLGAGAESKRGGVGGKGEEGASISGGAGAVSGTGGGGEEGSWARGEPWTLLPADSVRVGCLPSCRWALGLRNSEPASNSSASLARLPASTLLLSMAVTARVLQLGGSPPVAAAAA